MKDVEVHATTGTCGGGTCTLGDLAAGAKGTMGVGGTPTEGGVLRWSVVISSGSTSTQRQDFVVVYVGRADLVLTASAPPVSAKAILAKQVEWDFSVRNKGPDDATGVKLTFRGPGPHLSNVKFKVRGVPVSCSNGTCALGNLGPGSTAAVTLTATPTELGTINWQASVQSGTFDPTLGDVTTSGKIYVERPAARLVAHVYTSGVARVGQDLVFHLGVYNAGPDTALDLRWTWSAGPQHFENVRIDNAAGYCNSNATCRFGDVQAGKGAGITITVRPTTTEKIRYILQVTSGSYDPAGSIGANRRRADGYIKVSP
jgi:hypothetical protein